jgi:hypothetical protein
MRTLIFAILLPFTLAAQQEVAFPSGAVHWVAWDSIAGTYHWGVTMPDQVTTTGQPSFDTTRNEMEQLARVAALPIEFDTLPAIGERLEARAIYRYDTVLVIVRQTHDRTIFPPEQTPALFGIYRADGAEALEWIANEDVFLGTIRSYEGQLYRCIQAHFTLSNWQPPNVPALWQPFDPNPPPACPPWVQPTGSTDAYNIGACVTYQGQKWESLINANVWPPGTPGLWILKP